jgi:hypothetical protein
MSNRKPNASELVGAVLRLPPPRGQDNIGMATLVRKAVKLTEEFC